jgi:hypothetical protein
MAVDRLAVCLCAVFVAGFFFFGKPIVVASIA